MRIFPVGSHVKDIYNGSLEALGKALQNNNLRFVAYYAPWCAQSRKMVPQMGHAAEILRDTVRKILYGFIQHGKIVIFAWQLWRSSSFFQF